MWSWGLKSCIPQLQPECSNFRLPQQNLNRSPQTGWHYERCLICNYPACEVTITNTVRLCPHLRNATAEPPSFPRGSGSRKVEFKSDEIRNGESIPQLRKMVMGKLEFTKVQQQYVALTVYHQRIWVTFF